MGKRRSSNKVATPAATPVATKGAKTPTKAELLAKVAELEAAVSSSAKAYPLSAFRASIEKQVSLVDAAEAALKDGSFDAAEFGKAIRNAAQENYNKGRRVNEGKAVVIA